MNLYVAWIRVCLIPISCGTFELFLKDRQFYRLVLLLFNE